jgi:murein DD-endopeptidase MepM/ murein hydrolase activator NlpD
MSYGTQSYSKADPGNFNKFIVDKIKSAASMASEERKYAKAQAEKQKAEGIPEEEITKHDRGYFFGKSLSHEFGGDLFRRTKGTFSTDPSAEQDPALTKKQRFSAMVRGDVLTPEPFKQLELPLEGGDDKSIPVEDTKLKSWLSVAFDGIQKSYDNIAEKIGGLSNKEDQQEEKEFKSTQALDKIVGTIKDIKSFFDKNNKLKNEEIKIEDQQLELQLDSKEKQEMSQREASLEKSSDLTTVSAYDNPYDDEEEDDGEGNGRRRGMLDRVFDSFGRRNRRNGTRRTKGARRRLARRKIGGMKRRIGRGFSRGRRGIGRGLSAMSSMIPRKLSEGGVVPAQTEVKPETKFSKMSEGGMIDPSATKNVQPNVEPKNNIVSSPIPKSSQPPAKLAGGGIVDNPTRTTLNPGQAVVPLNRNNPLKKAFQTPGMMSGRNKKDKSGKKMSDQLGKALQLPAQAAGGLLISTMAQVFKQLGGVGQMFAPFFNQLMNPLARVFGLPANIIGSVLGGQPAAAATLDSRGVADFLKGNKNTSNKSSGSNGGGGTPPPPSPQIGPGMTATGGSKASGNITSGFGQRSSPGGIGSTNHGGIDIAGGAWRQGTPISVIKPGVVEETNDLGKSGWGKYVVIKHDDGTYTLYGHLDSINVKKGQKIENKTGAATVIGKVGSTGASTGPHLHFELGNGWNGTIKGKMDPTAYVDSYIRGGGTVAVSGDAPSVALGGNMQRPSEANSGTPKINFAAARQQSTATNNIFLNGGGSRPAPQSSPSYVNNTNALSLPTVNPSAPLYSYHW